MIMQILHCPHCQGTDIIRPWEDPARQATLLLPRDGMRRAHFPGGLQLRRSLRQDQATDRRHGDERQWHSGYRSRAACQSHHRHQRTEKKEPELQPVNHRVLASLNPAQVEVEIWRADELEVCRGLSSELDEMWSYVFKKANPRWLWHAIDHHTGTVLAYVLGRRQDTVFVKLK